MRTGTCHNCGESFEDLSRAQNRRFCSDNCRKRQHDLDTYRRPCEGGCGRLTWHHHSSGYCRECGPGHQRKLANWALIEGFWAEGLTHRQIAGRLGWSPGHVKVEVIRMRQAGRAVPKRPHGQFKGVPGHWGTA